VVGEVVMRSLTDKPNVDFFITFFQEFFERVKHAIALLVEVRIWVFILERPE